jgi:NDP-sugar pyrophosphorylase family protein
MGSRYGGLKQVDTIGPSGEAIIDYSIYDAIQAGFGKVVFVIRKHIETPFKAAFGNRFSHHIPVEYVFQELDHVPAGVQVSPDRVKPWGTGHAVLVADEAVREPFAVINADDFYGAGAFRMLAHYLSALEPDSNTHCMIGYQLANTLSEFGSVSRGVCDISPEGFLTGVTERTKIKRQDARIIYEDADGKAQPLAEDTIVSMNMFGFAPSIFAFYRRYFEEFIRENGRHPKAEFYIPTVVNRAVSEGAARVRVLRSDEKWFGVTYREDKQGAEQRIRTLISEGRYPEHLWR